jgi:hypothetical protein
MLRGLRSFRVRHPGVQSGGFFVRGLPTLAFHRINSNSAGNYQLIDMESTVRMGFFALNYRLRDEKSTRGRGFH